MSNHFPGSMPDWVAAGTSDPGDDAIAQGTGEAFDQNDYGDSAEGSTELGESEIEQEIARGDDHS